MELTGEWPQDADAVRRLRAALHLEIAKLLSQKHSLIAVGQADFVDIFKVIVFQNYHLLVNLERKLAVLGINQLYIAM